MDPLPRRVVADRVEPRRGAGRGGAGQGGAAGRRREVVHGADADLVVAGHRVVLERVTEAVAVEQQGGVGGAAGVVGDVVVLVDGGHGDVVAGGGAGDRAGEREAVAALRRDRTRAAGETAVDEHYVVADVGGEGALGEHHRLALHGGEGVVLEEAVPGAVAHDVEADPLLAGAGVEVAGDDVVLDHRGLAAAVALVPHEEDAGSAAADRVVGDVVALSADHLDVAARPWGTAEAVVVDDAVMAAQDHDAETPVLPRAPREGAVLHDHPSDQGLGVADADAAVGAEGLERGAVDDHAVRADAVSYTHLTLP